MRSRIPAAIACAIFAAIFVSGCFKDTVTERYSFYRPVFKSRAEVRAEIKSTAPRAIEQPGKLFVRGNYIFLNDLHRGIHIIDYTNRSAPKNIAFVNVPGNVDLAVNGNFLYADQATDLVTLDISNPRSISAVNFDEKVFPPLVVPDDSTLVLAGWVRVDTLIRHEDRYHLEKNNGWLFSTAASSPSAGGGQGKAGSMARFGMMNDRLYTVSAHDLRVFNITNAADPFFVKNVYAGSFDIETIYPFRNSLFLGSMTGMHIFSVSNPDHPVRTGGFSHFRACDPVIVDGDYAYVTLNGSAGCGGQLNQMEVVNVSNLAAPSLVKAYPFTSPKGLSKEGDHIFLCDGKAGFRVLDAKNVNSISTIQTIGGMDTYDVVTMNNTAIVVARDGLYLFDYSNTSNVKLLSKISKAN